MSWSVPPMWKDGTCYIIGGGRSVTTQFHIPNSVVRKVLSGNMPISEYSSHMSFLHDKHVIGINGAYLLGDWVDICFFGDKSWYFDNAKQLNDYKGLLVGSPEFLQLPGWQKLNIKYLAKSEKTHGISSDPSKVCWNYNSGAAAISLAVHTGVKRIVLIGFDMSLSVGGSGHWHNLYNGKTNMPFAKHLAGFDQIKLDADKLGVEIINASPESAIKQFQKMTIDEVIKL